MKVDATTKTGKEEEGCCGAKRKTRKHLWLQLKGIISNRPRSNFGSFLGERNLP